MYWFYYTCFGSDKCNHIVKSRYREKLCALLMEMWQTLKLCRYGGSPYTIAPPEMGIVFIQQVLFREVVTEKYRTVTNYLHGNQSKCICYRAKQDNCCKYRAEVFDHKVKNLFPAESSAFSYYFLLNLFHSHFSGN